MSTETKQISMESLIDNVLASEKFKKIIQNGESGYYDIDEKIFIPTRFIPSLKKEITTGPSAILGTNNIEDYFLLCNIRITRVLKTKFKQGKSNPYKQTMLKYISKEYLKQHADSTINFAALYIDLVGSTVMSMKLSSEHLSTLIGIYSNEMSSLVSMNNGYVLKYAGDAVIAFFPENGDFAAMCYNALNCAVSMNNLLNQSFNPAIVAENFEPLNIRVGIEAGSNKIMVIGGDVDIIGFNMNIAAKVQSMASPGKIGIGQHCYAALGDEAKKEFLPIELPSSWKYKDEDGNPYKLYAYHEQD